MYGPLSEKEQKTLRAIKNAKAAVVAFDNAAEGELILDDMGGSRSDDGIVEIYQHRAGLTEARVTQAINEGELDATVTGGTEIVPGATYRFAEDDLSRFIDALKIA